MSDLDKIIYGTDDLERLGQDMYNYFKTEVEEYFNSNFFEFDDKVEITIEVFKDLVNALKDSKKHGSLSLWI